MNTIKIVAIVALLGLSMGLGYSLYEKQSHSPVVTEKTVVIDHLPAFTYKDLQGNMRSSREWSDKVVVLNFWATWCPPCKKETPDFIKTQDKYSQKVQFVGIAIDDARPVQEFADSFGINYPTLLGDMDAIEISRQLGNRFSGLPFTAIFDREGQLRHKQTGEMKLAELEKQLQPLL